MSELLLNNKGKNLENNWKNLSNYNSNLKKKVDTRQTVHFDVIVC